MLGRIFPKQFDNVYRGHWLGLWLFVPPLLMELVIGVNSIFLTRYIATSADGIPLERYSNGGAEAVIATFALLGLCRVLFALLGVVALIGYRAMIPLMYLVFLLLQLGSKAILLVNPIAKSGAASAHSGSAVILSLLSLLVIGFVLSLLRKPAT